MGAWDWDHNAFYHRTLLRQLPQHCGRILEVGCGAGTLAARLARRADRIDAVDRSPEMIEAARRVVPGNVECTRADILEHPLPKAAYDAVVSLTTLHHLPLERVLPRLAHTLRPGGVLAVIALPRADPLRELPAEIAGVLGHRVFGATFATLRATGRGAWYAHEATHAAMPVVLDPPLTTREVARRAGDILPGARVRRLVFWRYLLRWDKPAQPR